VWRRSGDKVDREEGNEGFVRVLMREIRGGRCNLGFVRVYRVPCWSAVE
jgi:hypothetical protein